MKEGPSIPEQYLNDFIDKQARITSKLAAKTTDPKDPEIENAIYFDTLANEPSPWWGADNDTDDPMEGGHHGD